MGKPAAAASSAALLLSSAAFLAFSSAALSSSSLILALTDLVVSLDSRLWTALVAAATTESAVSSATVGSWSCGRKRGLGISSTSEHNVFQRIYPFRLSWAPRRYWPKKNWQKLGFNKRKQANKTIFCSSCTPSKKILYKFFKIN